MEERKEEAKKEEVKNVKSKEAKKEEVSTIADFAKYHSRVKGKK